MLLRISLISAKCVAWVLLMHWIKIFHLTLELNIKCILLYVREINEKS